MRNIKKAIEDYKKQFWRKENSHNRGAFYYSDYRQIADLSTKGEILDISAAIDNALMAGFMIGYRTARRESRERRK